jgi:hypothetical protein
MAIFTFRDLRACGLAMALALLMSLAGWMTGCGVKNAPGLDSAPYPPNIAEIQAVATEASVSLTWTLPEATEQNPYIGFQLYRKHWDAGEERLPANADTLLLATIDLAGLGNATRASHLDTDIKPGHVYDYHLFAYLVGSDGEKSFGRDTQVGPFEATLPAQAVTQPAITAGDGVAVLTWTSWHTNPASPPAETPATAEGDSPTTTEAVPTEASAAPTDGPCVLIYRAEGEEGPYGVNPLTPQPVFESTFSDFSTTPGMLLRYKIRSARLENGVLVLGVFSPELRVTVVDETPPPAPLVMWIKQVDGLGVRLRWQPVNDSGLLGYGVQRRPQNAPESAWQEVCGFLTVDECTDRSVSAPGVFDYRIWARDRGGNLSYSEILRQDVIAPAPEPAPEAAAQPEAAATQPTAPMEQAAPAPADAAPPVQAD